jgi:anti-sigma regulatory factor (Ser/Thr protein kinase)
VTLLEDNGWNDEETQSRVLLAVSEVVSNAVRHAYAGGDDPGDMEIEAEVDDSVLRVVVRDFGTVRLPSPDPGLGVGLRIVERCADEVHIRAMSRGTTVELVFRRFS